MSDLDALMALEQRVFSYDVMSRRSARAFIRSPNAVLLVARARDLLGYCLVLLRPRSVRGRLYSVAVGPRALGQGIGTALIEAGERAARRRGCAVIGLEVKPGNRAAIAVYRKLGYRQTGRRPRYYDDGADALRFEKRLYPQG